MKVREFKRKTGELGKSVTISRLDARGKILDSSDGMDVSTDSNGDVQVYEKIVLSMTEYDKDGNKPSVSVRHNLDLRDALVLCHDLLNNPAEIKFPTDYKGSPSKDYDTGYESRVLAVSNFDGQKGKMVTFRITNGPGVAGDKGQVAPAKEGTKKEVGITVALWEARAFAAETLSYIQAKMAATVARNWKRLYGADKE